MRRKTASSENHSAPIPTVTVLSDQARKIAPSENHSAPIPSVIARLAMRRDGEHQYEEEDLETRLPEHVFEISACLQIHEVLV